MQEFISGSMDLLEFEETLSHDRDRGFCWFNETFVCPHPCALLCPPAVVLIYFYLKEKQRRRINWRINDLLLQCEL